MLSGWWEKLLVQALFKCQALSSLIFSGGSLVNHCYFPHPLVLISTWLYTWRVHSAVLFLPTSPFLVLEPAYYWYLDLPTHSFLCHWVHGSTPWPQISLGSKLEQLDYSHCLIISYLWGIIYFIVCCLIPWKPLFHTENLDFSRQRAEGETSDPVTFLWKEVETVVSPEWLFSKLVTSTLKSVFLITFTYSSIIFQH